MWSFLTGAGKWMEELSAGMCYHTVRQEGALCALGLPSGDQVLGTGTMQCLYCDLHKNPRGNQKKNSLNNLTLLYVMNSNSFLFHSESLKNVGKLFKLTSFHRQVTEETLPCKSLPHLCNSYSLPPNKESNYLLIYFTLFFICLFIFCLFAISWATPTAY